MKSLLLLYAIVSATRAQQNDNITATPNVTTPSNLETKITEECTCIPYYLCDTSGIDGEDFIDLRDNSYNCNDYLMRCCPEYRRHDQDPLVIAIENETTPRQCGGRNVGGVGFRITGNTENEAEFAEFPWMTAVLREESLDGKQEKLLMYICGGSLIHPKVVMTAAHCVTDKEIKYKVRVGEWDTQTKNEMFPYQNRDVVTIITHPDYYEDAYLNDIALLILDEAVVLGPNIDTICLPPPDEVIERGRCFTSGWGKDVFGREGKYQAILKKLELPIVARDVCEANLLKTRLGPSFNMHKSYLCAGGEAGMGTCTGDGGSPLVCPIRGFYERYYQAGIVSWEISCGQQDVPGVYANVAMFTDWINSKLSSYGIDNSSYTY